MMGLGGNQNDGIEFPDFFGVTGAVNDEQA